MIKSISLIGAGNIATHLTKVLYNNGVHINDVFSENNKNAKRLAALVHAKTIQQLSEINPTSDLYIIATNDDAILPIASQLNVAGIVVHTSGNTSLNVLSNSSINTGVLWPLKSVSKQQKPDFKEIPICIEASNTDTLNKLLQLSNLFSNRVIEMTSEQREHAHLAAVFANNFSNYFHSIAESILKEKNIDFSILTPLITEAARQTEHTSPSLSQTGPAIRNDKKVLEKHLNLLQNNAEYFNLYKFVSESIIKKHHG